MASKNLRRTALEALPTKRLTRIYLDFVVDSLGDPRIPSRDEAVKALLAEVRKGPAWFIDYINACTVRELRPVVTALGGNPQSAKKAAVKEIDRLLGDKEPTSPKVRHLSVNA